MVIYIVIESMSIFWKKSQWVAQPHGGYIVNNIMKESRDFFQKVATGYIVNEIVKETKGLFQKVATGYIVNRIVKETRVFFQNVATDFLAVFFLKVISMYPLITLWSKWQALSKKIQHIPTDFWLD